MAKNFGKLLSLEEASAVIKASGGECLAISGDEHLLRKLPAGNWVGGTIPYFMGDGNGGVTSKDKLLIAQLPTIKGKWSVKAYGKAELPSIAKDAAKNGYSFILLPAFSEAHLEFAKNAPFYPDLFVKPLIGWVCGIHLADLGSASAKAFNGLDKSEHEQSALVVHIELPDDLVANIDILNIFEPDAGHKIEFPSTGFSVSKCLVDGKPASFAAWCEEHKVDAKLPLVADYYGANVNVCIREVSVQKNTVDFYAPVFAGVTYRFAKPVGNYSTAFSGAMKALPDEAPFACNCILNYLYGELEGKQVGMPGPVTFGEIAYQLLNQTMVYLTINKVS